MTHYYLSFIRFIYEFFFTDMFIGFPNRTSYVRENMFPTLSVFPIFRMLHSLRESEILYTVTISATGGTAEVTAADNRVGEWDVAFGTSISNILVVLQDLNPGETEITMIRADIMNDINAEDNETFTLRVSAADVGGIRRNFECYDDGEDPVEGNYFCDHTVIIIDDDGQFKLQYFQALT